MEFATGSGSVRDLPPSKRFKYVRSSLGLVPCLPAKKRLCPPMTGTAGVPVCLPAKKRAYAAAAVEEGDFALCLPAKKRSYVPPVDDVVTPVCLPVKKRAHASPPPPPPPGASPRVPSKEGVDALAPPPPLPEKADVSRSIPIPAKDRVPAPPREKAAASPSIPVPVRTRVHAPPPQGTDASPRVPFKELAVNILPPPRNATIPPSIPAKKSARAPPSPNGTAAPVSVCLPSNKRVMPPFLPPSPPPSVNSDEPRAAAVKEAKPQGSSKRGGAITNPGSANGVEDHARAEASKMPEKPINPEVIKEQVLKKSRSSTDTESKDQECKQSCKVISATQSEGIEVEAPKKACNAIDLNEAARDEDSWEEEEVARDPKQEGVAAVEEEEEDDGVHCAVCGSTDGDPSDPIVFCDGCDLMVHASCYGNPLAHSIPDGDWFCSVCSAAKARSTTTTTSKKTKPFRPRCCLCPARGGAMKRTTDGRWSHIACALLVPEVFFRDPDGRDGVDCSRVPAHRFATECYVCESSRGCALECSQPKCGLGFHVSCGLDAGLCIEYQEAKAGGGGVVAGFCLEHTKLWEKQQLTGKYRIVSRGKK
ncbi:lysine-specific demethylase 4B [Oryza brachyantha]|uniref:lysine-specific demethylase 4B n=1 Tax=Oryza brachyantha TaxID=4533 RepID=UPI0003EAA934|nr:lysine-specific demethylase 4B [Oryza brachyantha]